MRRYVGWPNIIPGVPARDLTEDEWADLPELLRDAAAPYYRREVGKAPPPPETPLTVTPDPAE